MNRKTFAIISWTAVALWAAVISYMSTDAFSGSHTAGIISSLGVPGSAVGEVNHVARKTAHLTEYAILGILLSIAVLSSWPRFYRYRGSLLLTLACAVWALSDEAHQVFVPSRTPSPVDVVIDTLGAGMGIYLLFKLRHLSKALRWVESEALRAKN